jgi:uncharacterized delta-60 repeat protein
MKPERTLSLARKLGCVASFLSIAAIAQNGQLDTNFAPAINAPIMAAAIQADGKVIIGGLFTEVNGIAQPYLARLNADGSLDTGFAPSQGPAQFVNRVEVTASGIVTSGGDGIRRFDLNGALQWHYPMNVGTFAVDPAQRVVIGGRFSRIENQFHRNLARLTADGTLDPAFAPEVGCCAGDGVDALLVTGSQVLVGGRFQSVNGSPAANLARANTDGSLDMTFAAEAEPLVLAMAAGPGGTIYRASEQRLARHLPNGALDPAFATRTPAGFDERFLAVAVHGDGVVVAGNFTFNDGGTRTHVARFDAAGALDSSFNVVPNAPVRALAVHADGTMIIAGDFTEVDGQPRAGIARVLHAAPGSPAGPALLTSLCASGLMISWPETTDNVVLESRAIAGGAWTAVSGMPILDRGRLCVTNPVAGAGRIFRLVRQ